MRGGWTLDFGGRFSSTFPSLARPVAWIAAFYALAAVPAYAFTGFVLEDTLVDPTGDGFGGAIASGDTVMLRNGAFPSTVHFFERDASGQWPYAQTITSIPGGGLSGGISVSGLDGDTALLTSGGPGATSSDRFFVFIRQSGQWTFATELVPPAGSMIMLGSGSSGTIGSARKLDGDRIVLPSAVSTKANPATLALVFERPAAGWDANPTLLPTTTIDLNNSAGNQLVLAGLAGDEFALRSTVTGSSLSTMEIWELVGGNWTHTATLSTSVGGLQNFGRLIFDGEAAAINVWDGMNNSSIQIQVFNRPSGGWIDKTEDAVLTIGASAGNGTNLVALDGTTIIAQQAAFNTGDVFYVFDAPAGGWATTDTPAQTVTTPTTSAAAYVGGLTIVAVPYVYRATDARVDLSVEKTASANPVTAREDFTYTLTVRNDSLFAATNVTLTDGLVDEFAYVSHTSPAGTSCTHTNAVDDGTGRLVGGTFQCDLGTLASLDELTVTLTVDAPALTGLVPNTVTVTSSQADLDATDNTSSFTTTVELAELADSQGDTHDNMIDFGAVVLNEMETQTVTVLAYGNAPTTIVSVSPLNPPYTVDAVACVGQALNPGESCAFDVTFAPTVLGGPQSGTITVDFGEYSLDLDVTGSGTLVLITDTQGDPTDRLIDFGAVFVGQAAQHTVTIENRSGADLLIGPIAIADPLEPNPPFSIPADLCSNTMLADGAMCTFDLLFDADAQRPLTSDDFSIPVEGGMEIFTVRGVSVLEELDLSISKSGPITINNGTWDSFTISVRNVSGGNASGVLVQDVLPNDFRFIAAHGPFGEVVDYDRVSGVWTIGDLLAGQLAELVLDFGVVDAAFPLDSDTMLPAIGCRINTAMLIGLNEQDVDPDNNEASFYTAVNTPSCADVAVSSIAESEDPVLGGLYEGGIGTYTVTVENLSPPQVAQGTKVTFQAAGGGFGIILQSGNLVAPDCFFTNANSASTLECTIGDFTGTREFTFNVQGPASGGTLTLTAEIEAAFTVDPDESNNSATETTVFNQENTPIPPQSSVDICKCISCWALGGAYINELNVLRSFRDRFLARSALGRLFINWYYEISPAVNSAMDRHESLRTALFALIMMAVFVISYPFATGTSIVLGAGLVIVFRRGRWQAAWSRLRRGLRIEPLPQLEAV